jgi:hypothetical protein
VVIPGRPFFPDFFPVSPPGHAKFAFLCGAGAVDSGGNVTVGLVAGALVGVFFGLIFGGVRGKWLDAVLGPEEDGEDDVGKR